MFNRKILSFLENWKVKKNRKPLILRGARQAGKTSVVKLFGQKSFVNLIYINMEKADDFALFKNINSLTDFIKTVDIVLKEKIIPGKTLIFIDEIQNTPNLISLLRFFYEERPDIHVVAAGSLLEVKIAKQDFAMPVGRVEYAFVHPLTFFEFLEAINEKQLLDYLQKITLEENIPNSIHEKSLKLFNEYTLVGGMPEAVSLYSKNSLQSEINSLYSSLLTAYSEDIYKYATQANVKYIQHVLEQAPYFAGERITYEKFGGSNFRSREMGEAFGVLEKAMILQQIPATESFQLPLIFKKKRAKKLLYLDSGLVNFKNNIQSEFVNLADLNSLYRGKIAEQIVGQNILADMELSNKLSYWAKERPNGSAEIDFCLSFEGSIFGIEVKSGHSGKLKSLFSFAKTVENVKLARIYSGVFKKELIDINNKKHYLHSIPFYLINRLFNF